MTFAEWLANWIKYSGEQLSDYSRRDINLLRRAFQAGEMNMRTKAAILVKAEYTTEYKDILHIKLDSG